MVDMNVGESCGKGELPVARPGHAACDEISHMWQAQVSCMWRGQPHVVRSGQPHVARSATGKERR